MSFIECLNEWKIRVIGRIDYDSRGSRGREYLIRRHSKRENIRDVCLNEIKTFSSVVKLELDVPLSIVCVVRYCLD